MPVCLAPSPTPFDARRAARSLYWRGWAMQQISDDLGVKYATIASWKTRDKWDDAPMLLRMQDGLQERWLTLIAKENKSGHDFKEIDLLGRQIERLARVEKFGGETGRERDLNPNIERRNDDKAKAKRAEKRKNCLTIEQYQALLDDFHDRNFEYQEEWWDQRHQRTRKIRKSRQVGATWYFAREAFAKIAELAIEGKQPRNQIFLSASERQALKFRREITNWVRRVTGVELKGKIIMLDFTGLHGDDGPSLDSVGLYPLSTNSATAQGESGDFYFDEFSWVAGFAELNKVASAMATHSIYTKTYFSSASTKTHESYAFWSGEDWNRGRAKGDQRAFDLSIKNLRNGAIMPDGSWQQILTIHDAVKRGLGDLVDVEQLQKEYSEDSFRNLFECEEIDDAQSSFPFSLIGSARVDSFYQWRDFKPELIGMPGARPFGDRQVWLGYDPNKQGRDDAALAVIAPPEKPGGKFRVLEKLRFNGIDFQGQADEIKKVAQRYSVVDIAIDTTGSGEAVLQLVLKWFPTARRINYTVAVKAALVMKGQNVFRNKRIEFDAGWTDVQAAFMAIRPSLTGSGRQVTYTAKRNGEVGHADIAWAILHALSNEPMDASEPISRGAKVRFFNSSTGDQ